MEVKKTCGKTIVKNNYNYFRDTGACTSKNKNKMYIYILKTV